MNVGSLEPTWFALLLALGLGNWIATEIFVASVICEDLREWGVKFGQRVEAKLPRLGRKIVYFTRCALCVGIWIGFAQAAVFGGPFRPQGGWFNWTACFVANALACKGIGHLLLQLNAVAHHYVQLLTWRTRRTEWEAKEKKAEAEVIRALSSNGSRPSAPAAKSSV